jgi:hypothetical protein
LATLGAVAAIAAAGLVGTVGLVATAGPAGAASTPTGTTNCALSQPAGETPISASITASVSPSPVNAGDNFSIAGLELTSTLVANDITSEGAGKTLAVTFTTDITATNATPSSQQATFSGSVTLPNPFPVGDTAPISLPGTVGQFTADSGGATSTQVFFNPSGQLNVSLGTIQFSGACTGPPPVEVASANIIPAAGFITNVIPNAGVSAGGTTVKLVGTNFGGATAVHFGSALATNLQVLSSTVITCTAPQGPASVFPYGSGNTQAVEDITVTTAAGTSKLQPLDQFTYVDPTLGAIVTRVTPNVGQAGGGNAVTITGVGFDDVADGGGPAFAVNFGSVNQPNFTVVSNTAITTTAPPGTGVVDVTVVGNDESTLSPVSPADRYNYDPGYFQVGSDGGVFSFGQVPGNAGYYGSAGNLTLNQPIVGMATTPDGGGYWLVAADGGVFAYGDAMFYGSAGNLTLNSPVVGMATTPDGAGYWLVAADGGVFAYGDAMFYGSTGGLALAAPVVGMAATPDGAGYWLVGADGGVFAYGDAQFHGAASGTPLAAPIVGIAATPNGGGYWLAGADGGVFNYGDAGFHGSLAGTALAWPISGIASTGDGGGYWLTALGGGVFNLGDAGYYGEMAGIQLNGPIVGFAAVQPGPEPV